MEDYFDILREDMLANFRTTQSRIARSAARRSKIIPTNLLAGEVSGYYSTILCFDLVKFSDITKTGETNLEASLLLNTVVPTVIKILTDFKGIVIDTSGDQVTALFGMEAPDVKNATSAAVQAALYTTNFIEHIADKFIGKMLPNRLRCSIGIDQGPVHVSLIGRKNAAGLVAIGPPVHIARNLHFLAGNNEIWVGENVYNSLAPDFAEKFFVPADVGNWPWVSSDTGEQYQAYKFNDNT